MMNYEVLRDWSSDARRGLEREVERLRDKEEQISEYLRALDATDELLAEIANLTDELTQRHKENNLLTEELEARQEEVDSLHAELEKKQAEIDKLQLQQQLQEADAKPTEIHNHFETGSSAQVFNDRVTGKFAKIRKWKQREKCKNRKKREKGKAS